MSEQTRLTMRSLRLNLVLTLAFAFVLVWLAVGWFAYDKGLHEADELLDGQLALSVRLLEGQINHEEQEHPGTFNRQKSTSASTIDLAQVVDLDPYGRLPYEQDRHGHEQDDDHDGYEQDECHSRRGSCNIAASTQSSYSSSSRSGSGYEHGTREGCSEDGDDSHGSNHQESNHNSACAAPVQTSAAAPSSISSRIADSSSRFENSYLEESSNDDQSSHYEHSNDGGSGGGD
jgi:hypothetical protein